MRWFKLHTEARNDQKLEALTDAQFRIWFRLLCYAAEQEERGTCECDEDLLAVEVAKGDLDILNATLERLIRLRIVAKEDESISFINFTKRQYDKPSDYPEEVRKRVKRHRNAKCNADVTPCNAEKRLDTDTDTDTEQIQKQKKTHYADLVLMTEVEHGKLLDKYGAEATAWMIDKLSNFKGAKGKQYKSDYKAILSWVVDAWEEHQRKGGKTSGTHRNDDITSEWIALEANRTK